jgi:hypothetical protein
MWSGEPANWWNQPNLQFDTTGNPIVGSLNPNLDVSIPPWMTMDPQEFYTLYNDPAFDATTRAGMIATMKSEYEANQRNLAGQDRGREWLGGAMDRTATDAASWADDPYRQMVMESMSERAAPGYQFFSPMERTSAVLPIAQQMARGNAQMAAGAAARGMSGSGAELQRSGLLAGQANIGETMVRAGMDASQRSLSQQAVSDLARTTAGYEGVDQQYLNASNQLAGALAALEMGIEFEPTDYTVWPALAEASRQAEQEAADRQRMIAAMEEEARYNWQDLGNAFASAKGGGLPAYLMAGLTGIPSLLESWNQAA